MKNNKWTIWQNVNLDIDDYEDYFSELETEYDEELSEDERWERLYEDNSMWLDDERCNLNVRLEGEIVVIADLGLWYGRRGGYKIIESGNVKDCLYDDADYVEWYCDRYDFRCNAHHHDGSNHYLYREIRPDLTETQRENFLDRLCHGNVNDRRMIRRYTRSVRPAIAKVYGW